ASSDGALFVEAWQHSGGMAPEHLPVLACEERLSSTDEQVRIHAAACLSNAGSFARGSVDRMIATLERAPSLEEKQAHLRLLFRISPGDVALHERVVQVARRLQLEVQLDPLHGLDDRQLEAALHSTDEALRLRAAEA